MSDVHQQENLWAYRKRLRFITSVIDDAFESRNPDSLRLLDVGCGNGSQLSLPLARLGFDVTGLDPDHASIAHAKSLSSELPNARFACGLIESCAEETFDVVILSEVIEHVENPTSLLMTAARRLSDDGVVIVTTPNGYGEFEIDSWLFRKLRGEQLVTAFARTKDKPLASTDNENSGHIQFFTRRRLHVTFAQCGLSVWRENGSSLFAGPFAGHSLARSQRFIEWNAKITDRLPLALASGWYFALRKKKALGAGT